MTDQKPIVEALMKPETYDEYPGRIELIQTHISFIFLTQEFVYKVKKAVDLGFLDFTTLEKRHFFCRKELEINRKLCEDMYLEVVPINKSQILKIKGKGKTVEYAVKMKRIPQEKMMSNLLEENKIDKNLIEQIAEIIAEFHSKAETLNKKINNNLPELDPIVEANWKENFDQTREFIGKTISAEEFELVRQKIEGFIERNFRIFKKRMEEGRVKYCHGDIHSGNIFIADKIYIFDAIEFNDRIRCSDVTADIGFLAMDLDFRKRGDLSEILVNRYVKCSGDEKLSSLLPFYKSYRAYVRGKVISFKLRDPNIIRQEKIIALKESKAYFRLAASYSESLA